MQSYSAYLNTPNYSGQLSLPPFTPYSLLTLNNSPFMGGGITGTPPFVSPDNGGAHTQAIPVGDMNLPQGTLDPNKIDPNPLNLGIQDTITSWLSTYFKDMTLLSLALILLGIGLYMLANSTKTGQAAIGAATKAAMA